MSSGVIHLKKGARHMWQMQDIIGYDLWWPLHDIQGTEPGLAQE